MTRVALLQMTSGIDPHANAAALVAGIAQAARGGAAMLFTPEMSGLLDRNRERAGANIVAEGDDRVLAAVREAAAKEGLWTALGSLARHYRPPSARGSRSILHWGGEDYRPVLTGGDATG